MSDDGSFAEDGFEVDGEFYPWHISDVGKDLMLIDRFSGMPITDFFDVIDDPAERGRAPILLSLIACSIRARNPDWSVQRIERMVMRLELGAVTFIESDDEGTDDADPLPASELPAPTSLAERSKSTRSDSSPSSTPEASTPSETSYATPV